MKAVDKFEGKTGMCKRYASLIFPTVALAVFFGCAGGESSGPAQSPADLDAEVEIKGEKFKTVFRMLRERAHEKTIEECEKICDIPAGTISRSFAGCRTGSCATS